MKSEFLKIMHERGFVHQCSDLEALDAKLCEEVQSAYIGYDPTGPSLHVGHLYTIMILHWFQQCGHKPISLMGGGTALIPDPTLKDKTRPLLGPEDINKNIDSIKTVFAKFITYDDSETGAVMVNNYDWLSTLDYIGFLRDIGTHFTINRMLGFDSVKTRLDRELPMTFIEFNYMILQGYDFLELHRRFGTVLQMGGSDQWGNIINGVELGRKKDQARLFALTAPLLTTASGTKMGKTEGGAVWLNADQTSPYEYWQYWRNVEDADTATLLKVFTTLPMDEIRRLEVLQGAEINEAKKVLAFEATKLCHGEVEAKKAQETAEKTFEQGTVGDDLPSFLIDGVGLETSGYNIIDLFCSGGLAKSKGEARRLIKGGGAKCNDKIITNADMKVFKDDLIEEGYIKLSAGKKRHVLARVK